MNRYLLKMGMAFFTMMIGYTSGCCISVSNYHLQTETSDTMKLYPYLAENGLYGYADNQLVLYIPPQYTKASMFTSTGFAVISDGKGRSGVINRSGELVVPMDFTVVRLQVMGEHTLAWTERSYTNSLRFWEWEFWPGFWSSNDNRLFDTDVKRVHLRITVLETGQRIFSNRTSYTYGNSFNIKPLDDRHFIKDGKLYTWHRNRFKTVGKHVFGQLDDGLLLQQKGKHFRVIDLTGKPVSDLTYRYLDSMRYLVGGKEFRKRLVLTNSYPSRVAKVFEDKEGRHYLFPDFSKPFPTDIAAQVRNGLSADSLIRRASLMGSIPRTDRFIVRSYNDEIEAYDHWTLDTAGNWHVDVPEGNAFFVTTRTGNILWPSVHTVVPDTALPTGWQLGGYQRVGKNGQLYQVRIRREESERMGVWDAERNEWLWQPDHVYIRGLDAEQGYWTFQPIKGGKYGLYHLPTERVILPPTYHDMYSDGMVSYFDDKRGYLRFYLDWETQLEYRDK